MKVDRQPPTKPTTPNIKIPELLSPAGNWECAKAAVENGADAIYFGLEQFNARMRAQNITTAELPKLMEYLHLRGVKGYVTLNTLIFPQELTQAEQYLRTIIAAGVDAVIVQDIGICRLIRHLSPDFPIHASTQMTITSTAGVEFAKSLGCQLVVLARECSIQEIEKIQKQLKEKQISLPLEVFVHGALCVAYSGQCLTSEALGGRSANRGECAQACRMPYELIADGKLVELGDKKYLLSPQDLAGLDVLPELVKAGVSCLKIEGRLKAPEYVANVTRVYRQALDRIIAFDPPKSPLLRGTLNPVPPLKKGTLKSENLNPVPPLLRGARGDQNDMKQQKTNIYNAGDSSDRYNLDMAFSRG
ncbi:MAG TPA: peptidase U32 family protein, partial [Phormidium sp.]